MLKQDQGIGMTSQRTRDRMITRLKAQGITDERVLDVMKMLPRHLFMNDDVLASRAYEDTPLAIGYNQTISQPYTVAKMTEIVLATKIPVRRVLEIGTGSGYQAAVLSMLIDRVFSVERIAPLQNQARERFYQMKLNNIRLKHSDGSWGWEEHGPYDAIIVTAAPEEIPQNLLDQLAPQGRLVIPVGDKNNQTLRVIDRADGHYEETVIETVSFVPLLAGQA
jgi:protein-L-isoaspartate(D-aspartate) O-methyltransferase